MFHMGVQSIILSIWEKKVCLTLCWPRSRSAKLGDDGFCFII